MLVTAAFGNHSMQHDIIRIEKETFAPLRKLGLTEFAHAAYERFAEHIEIEPTQHTQNAYLLQFQSLISGKLRDSSPEEIENTLLDHLHAAKIITRNGADYLKYHGQDAPPSDALYAASIAAPVMHDKIDHHDLIALIGHDAVRLKGEESILLNNHADYFQKSTCSPDTKALHLSRLAKASSDLIDQCDTQIENTGYVDTQHLQAVAVFIEHLEKLNPLPKRTDLEDKVYKRMRILEHTLASETQKNQPQIAKATNAPPSLDAF